MTRQGCCVEAVPVAPETRRSTVPTSTLPERPKTRTPRAGDGGRVGKRDLAPSEQRGLKDPYQRVRNPGRTESLESSLGGGGSSEGRRG